MEFNSGFKGLIDWASEWVTPELPSPFATEYINHAIASTRISLRTQWLFFSVVLRPNVGHGLLILEVFQITHNDAPESVGLLWTSDRLVAETSTWQHTTLTTDKYLCPRRDSNHYLSRRAAAHLRLRPRGHWDRQEHTDWKHQSHIKMKCSFQSTNISKVSIYTFFVEL